MLKWIQLDTSQKKKEKNIPRRFRKERSIAQAESRPHLAEGAPLILEERDDAWQFINAPEA